MCWTLSIWFMMNVIDEWKDFLNIKSIVVKRKWIDLIFYSNRIFASHSFNHCKNNRILRVVHMFHSPSWNTAITALEDHSWTYLFVQQGRYSYDNWIYICAGLFYTSFGLAHSHFPVRYTTSLRWFIETSNIPLSFFSLVVDLSNAFSILIRFDISLE